MTPLVITARNAMAATGMSWPRVKQIAREHGVPVWTIGARTSAIPAAAWLAAVAAHATPVAPTPPRDEADRIMDALGFTRG